MSDIVVSTLNARYSHSSLGLRYLMANMGELREKTELIEFVIDTRPIDIVEQLLKASPKIIGLGVYIWNIIQVTEVVSILKTVSPETVIVLGGPEVSFEYDEQEVVKVADYVICGAADREFALLCQQLLSDSPPPNKIIPSIPLKLEQIVLPYAEYTDMDISTRNIYVEASRGCPFKCEFCLSALDTTAKPFDLDLFIEQMQVLYDRGARRFRFVDRTFNIKADTSARILAFFLERMDDSLFVHFEVIPDHLPEKLKELIVQFPPGALQFEIGVQTFNSKVQHLISRKQDNAKSGENLNWLRSNSQAHIHADLIAGLPGEDIESFAKGFDSLVEMNPHEIQLGILKRLRGSPIIRHTEEYDLRFNPFPPYNILSTRDVAFGEMQLISRFARYWDLIGNSGRFVHTLPVILGSNPFANFMSLSQWIFGTTGRMHKLSLQSLFQLIYQGSLDGLGLKAENISPVLENDFLNSGIKGTFEGLLSNKKHSHIEQRQRIFSSPPSRQARHIK